MLIGGLSSSSRCVFKCTLCSIFILNSMIESSVLFMLQVLANNPSRNARFTKVLVSAAVFCTLCQSASCAVVLPNVMVLRQDSAWMSPVIYVGIGLVAVVGFALVALPKVSCCIGYCFHYTTHWYVCSFVHILGLLMFVYSSWGYCCGIVVHFAICGHGRVPWGNGW